MVEMVFILGIAVMCAIIFAQTNSTQATATLALFIVAGFPIMPSITRVMSAFNTVRVGKSGVDLVLADFDEVPAVKTDPAPVERSCLLEGFR